MRVKIRKSIFETNSSSMHSLSFAGNIGLENLKSELPIRNGKVCVSFGEYGWEMESYDDQQTKLSYILTMLKCNCDYGSWDVDDGANCTIGQFKQNEIFKEIAGLVKKYAGVELAICNYNDEEYDDDEKLSDIDGYIDHQSMYKVEEFLDENGITAEEFIFSPYVILNTDNDNH